MFAIFDGNESFNVFYYLHYENTKERKNSAFCVPLTNRALQISLHCPRGGVFYFTVVRLEFLYLRYDAEFASRCM